MTTANVPLFNISPSSLQEAGRMESRRKRGSEVVAFKGAVFNNSAGGVWSDSDAAGGCSETRKITERIKTSLSETLSCPSL